MRRLRPAPGSQWPVIVGVAAAHFGFDFASPFLPLYVTELGVSDVGAAAVWSGLAIGIAPAVAAISTPLWAIWGRNARIKTVVIRSLCGFVVSLLLMAIVQNAFQLVLARGTMGIFGGFTALATAMVVLNAKPGQTGRAIGSLQASQFLSLAVAPVLGGLVAAVLGLRANFVISAVLVLVAIAILAIFLVESERARPSDRQRASSTPLRGVLIWVVPLLVAIGAARFVERTYVPTIPLMLLVDGYSTTELAWRTGVAQSLGAAAAMLAALVAGVAASRFGGLRVLAPGFGLAALGVASLTLANDWQSLLVFRILAGFATGVLLTLAYASTETVLPNNLVAAFFGVAATAAFIGTALGAPAAGLLSIVDLRLVFVFDAIVLGSLAMAIAMIARRSLLPRTDPAA